MGTRRAVVVLLAVGAQSAGALHANAAPAAGSVTTASSAAVLPGFALRGWRAWPWACRAPGCIAISESRLRSLLERQRRFDELRQDSNADPGKPAQALWIDPQRHYLPPATPERQIQPAYAPVHAVQHQAVKVDVEVSG